MTVFKPVLLVPQVCRRCKSGTLDLPQWIVKLIHKQRSAWYRCRMNGEYNNYRLLRNKARKAIRKFYHDADRTLFIENNRTHFSRYVKTHLCKSRGSLITL